MISEKHRSEIFTEPQYFLKRPTFIDGVASNFDLFNARRVQLHLSQKIDYLGMKSDFDLVGSFLHDAIKKFSNGYNSRS